MSDVENPWSEGDRCCYRRPDSTLVPATIVHVERQLSESQHAGDIALTIRFDDGTERSTVDGRLEQRPKRNVRMPLQVFAVVAGIILLYLLWPSGFAIAVASSRAGAATGAVRSGNSLQ